MAVYRVQGPDGAVHRFEGPENATPEQVTAAAQQKFGSVPPSATQPRPLSGNTFSLGTAARNLVSMAGLVPGLPSTVSKAPEIGRGFIGSIPGTPGDLQAAGQAIPDIAGATMGKPFPMAGDARLPTSSEMTNTMFGPAQSSADEGFRALGGLGGPNALLAAVRQGGRGAATISRMVAPNRGIPPEAVGTNYVTNTMNKAGRTIADLQASDKPITSAEALGAQGQTNLMALARRPGATADDLQAALTTRSAERGGRIQDDLASAAGVHPAAAKGDIEALVQAGQAKAAPLFKQALEAPGPVWNQDLARLAQRPAVQKALKLAVEDLKNADINPGTVGLGEDTHLGALADVQYARAPSKKGETIFDAIKKFGGIRLENGANGAPVKEAQEVSNILQDVKHPGLVSQYGKTPDYMREALAQDGWFVGNPTNGADIGEFYDALAQQAQGAPYVHPNSAGAGAAYARQGLDQEMTQAGITAGDSTKDAARKLAKHRGANTPAGQIQPTAQAWDLIRKALGRTVERDAFGKPIPDSISAGNHNINAATRDLTGALKSAILGYGDALDVSGEYLRSKSAFERGQSMILDNKVTESQFSQTVSKLAPSELEALKGGIANKIFDLSQGGKLRPAQILTPRVKAKMAAALGPAKAAQFIGDLEKESAMRAFEMRAGPAAGSQTQPLAQAMKEQDTFGQTPASELIGSVAQHGVRGAATRLGASTLQKIGARLKTTGLSEEARNEAGRLLLLPPDELASLLRSAAAKNGGKNQTLRAIGNGLDPRLISPQLLVRLLSAQQSPVQPSN